MASECDTSGGMPVVDFGQLGDEPNEDAWRAAGKKIEAAFREFGFVYVLNHQVPKDVVARAVMKSEDFFKLSTDEKNTVESVIDHGYMFVGRQKIAVNYEMRETFEARDLDGLFPDDHVPELRSVCAELTAHLTACGAHFLKALEYGLELEEGRLVKVHSRTLAKENPKAWLRLANYPPVAADYPPGAMRVDCHTDYTTITFDIQDELGGLEVLNRQGEWVLARAPQEGAILVIVGEILEKWTSGKFVATEHRVKVPESERLRKLSRRATIFFFVPDDETTLAPLDGSPSESSHLTAKEFIKYKQEKTLNY